MTINEILISALQGIAPTYPWELDEEDGDERKLRRILFNYNTVPDTFGDNAPAYERYLIQVHYFCPKSEDSIKARGAIKRALFMVTEDWPEEILVSRESKQAPDEQHYCFETEYLLPIGEDGADGEVGDERDCGSLSGSDGAG